MAFNFNYHEIAKGYIIQEGKAKEQKLTSPYYSIVMNEWSKDGSSVEGVLYYDVVLMTMMSFSDSQ